MAVLETLETDQRMIDHGHVTEVKAPNVEGVIDVKKPVILQLAEDIGEGNRAPTLHIDPQALNALIMN